MDKRLAERVSDFSTAVNRPAIPRAGGKGGRMGDLATKPMPFGLSAEILDDLRQVFSRFSAVDRVLIYGSRARGDFRPGSDIDLLVLAPTMAAPDFAQLWMALDDLPIIFHLDVALCQEVDNQRLKQNMLADGIMLYHNAGLKVAT